MKKYDILYFESGTQKIIKELNISKTLLLKTEADVRRIVQISAKNINKSLVVGELFLTALTNLYLYRLAILGRNSLNVEEESLLSLFGRVLNKKNLDEMSDSAIKILTEDFTQHIFEDITYNREVRNWVPHKNSVPSDLLKLVGYSSLNQEDSHEG
jgi:hypothetical protein